MPAGGLPIDTRTRLRVASHSMDTNACPAGSRAVAGLQPRDAQAAAKPIADAGSTPTLTAYDGPDWLSVPKAARLVGVDRRSIYLWAKAGKLAVAYLPSGIMRVQVSSLLSTNDAARLARHEQRKAQRKASQRRNDKGTFVPAENAVENAVAAGVPSDLRSVGPAQLSTPAAPGSSATTAAVAVRRVPVGRRMSA